MGMTTSISFIFSVSDSIHPYTGFEDMVLIFEFKHKTSALIQWFDGFIMPGGQVVGK
jgi:hypothetical protein